MSENVPEQEESFSEDLVPAPGLGGPQIHRVRGTHDQVTRRMLAAWILALLGLLYLGIFSCYLFGSMNDSKLTASIAALSGPQALAAAAIGFYYGKPGKQNP